MEKKMYEYYAAQNIQPTYADFSGDAELSKYARLRKDVFARLGLPPAIFKGNTVLEFGPDTGENSLVFAQWGAKLTLVEPNLAAHPYIRNYFAKFDMESSLDDIVPASLLDFKPKRQYGVIDAEGFIYTVKPTSAWIAKAAECLEMDGFFVITYNELYGGFMELLLKAIYSSVIRNKAYAPGVDSAKQAFQPKWDSIPHTRKIESWFMDVIVNPFVRKQYFIDPVALLKEANIGGFRLHSAWPNYRDALAIEWIKAAYSVETETQAAIEFVEQNRLSHFLGKRCFLPQQSAELNANLTPLVDIVDALIDEESATACKQAQEHLDALLAIVDRCGDVTSASDLQRARATLNMIKAIFGLIEINAADKLIDFCRTDATFISTWGMPNHHAVLQKTRDVTATPNK